MPTNAYSFAFFVDMMRKIFFLFCVFLEESLSVAKNAAQKTVFMGFCSGSGASGMWKQRNWVNHVIYFVWAMEFSLKSFEIRKFTIPRR